ncbi:hypothetical protein [Nocardioides sp. AE5]|uniref:hypothetical protein n=1 Tax=Nocardioides sp. AE5 TaxID=2962573 RepID=UPI00288180E8|nr:hypothetical protein [Nocardioides sp. AE5]MDT0201337.1 hypothetical protein [Nocardioides sp. AE5]
MLDEPTQAALRLCVHALRASTPQRTFTPALHLGTLGGEHVTLALDDDLLAADVGLRSDLAVELAQRAAAITDRPAAWLTRMGWPQPHDLDVAWLPVVRRGLAELGLVAACAVVVTKNGWYDPFGGGP